MQTLAGKIAVVTGAGSGIGRGIALALADAGAHVVVSDIRAETAAAVAQEVRDKGVRGISVVTNVADPDAVRSLADTAYAEFGRVDILVNNAGVTWRPFRTILDATIADWKFILDTNVWGVVHGLDSFPPRMREQAGDKHIVNTASVAAVLPLAGHGPYTASKAAVASLTECCAQELGSLGFGFTVLCPAYVQTNVVANSESMRAPGEKGSERNVETYHNPLQAKLFEVPKGADEVGKQVCDAILRKRLYVHTHPLPEAFVKERVAVVFDSEG